MNEKVAKYLKAHNLTLQVKKSLAEMSDDDWPTHPCISCKWWVALSPEMNLGECRASLPVLGKVKEKPEFAITPPNYCCRHHWGRNLDAPTFGSFSEDSD